ncbi:MAG TPA: prepilin peptidase [Cyanobacteria bacterium UBA8530]|nr:prepilin peptidase [Cyanobacteria bacterium UBA8530]
MRAFFLFFSFLYGLLIGSFLNVVIHRLPKRESVAWPASHCPRCFVPLEWWENIPLLSFLGLRGRCRTCKQPISWRYPLVEAATGLLFLLVFHLEGFGIKGIALALFCSLLVVIFWIDIDEMLILNVLTFPGIALGLAFSAWNGHFLSALLAGVGGYVLFEAIAYLSLWILKKEGMGHGDTLLAAMLGAWLGVQGLIVALYFSFFIGAVVGLAMRFRRGKSEYFPFGPAMVIGGLLSLFWGASIGHWYLALF